MSDVEVHLKVGPNVSGVTSNNGYVLYANNVVPVHVNDRDKINAIAGSAGTLRFHKVG